MMQRKILIALALMVFVAVTGSLILFTQGTWRAVAGDSLTEMIPAVEIPGCSWNDVASVVPDQFEGNPPEFLAFERGYHRAAICPNGMVNVVILSYDSVAQAQTALEAARKQKPSKGDTVASFDNPDGDPIEVWKTWSAEGSVLYVATWRQENRLEFITEETTPQVSEQQAMERLQRLLDRLLKDGPR